ncbi:MAG: SNF2/RAD54 family helicase, partial [Marinilabiliaceae bacterium]|nr:SNF2/RAD54 family helicase [Marinilabiliaceae bacterium]
FVTNGSLSKVLDVDNNDYWNADEYDLVLVDEAHKFRNHTTTAFSQLQEICKMPRVANGKIPGPKKKVMLISATPMNNSPEDLYTQIQLFQDPRRCTIDGVPNLTTFFSPLIHEYKSLKREFNKNGLPQFKELAERVRDRVIKPITVRRTRTDIEAIPRYNKDIQGFPKVAPPEKKCYEMSNRIADLFEKSMISLVEELTYARYQAIAYLKPEIAEGLYDNAELVSRSLASIRKNGLVKRLESSFCAFKKSVERFRDANQYMINMFVNNRVFIAPDLDINHLYDLGLNDDEIEERIQLKAESNPKNAAFTADDFDPEFITMLRNDQLVLERMCAEWETVDVEGNDDSKFATFNDILKHELFKKERNPGQKLVVFSESVDTVEYLAKRINRDDVLVVSAANRSQLYQTIRENFDANFKKAAWKNEYNIILTTDVLAEGVNLHRSNIIINYDTPWNSTKLMQRIGRVNRIGSEGKNIYNYVFHPSRQGNEIIKLTQIALSKIQSFHSTFGEDNKIYSQEEIIERNFDKLFNEGMESAKRDLNEEILFSEELRSLYDTDRSEYNRIAQLSLRSRTGREARSVDGVSLSQDTLVFIKTNMRKSFFRASDESVEELSVVDALKYFKADAQEPRTDRIQNHHDHVSKALRMFNAIKGNEAATQEQNAQQPSTPAGGQMGMATSLLNSLINLIQDSNVRQQVVQLKKIAERGVINVIPRKLQNMQRALQRGDLKRDEALSQIIDMAKRYNNYYLSSEELENEAESEAQIILSESFK